MSPTTSGSASVPEPLPRLPLFTGPAGQQLTVISSGSRIRAAGKGTVLFHRNDPVRGFCLEWR